jgi:hypothetical protein
MPQIDESMGDTIVLLRGEVCSALMATEVNPQRRDRYETNRFLDGRAPYIGWHYRL